MSGKVSVASGSGNFYIEIGKLNVIGNVLQCDCEWGVL